MTPTKKHLDAKQYDIDMGMALDIYARPYVYNDRCIHILPFSKDNLFVDQFERYNGDYMQIIRYMCWLCEDRSARRQELMRQWLNTMKRRRQLPSLEIVLSCIKPTIQIYAERDQDIALRLKEARQAYHKTWMQFVKVSPEDVKYEDICGAKYHLDVFCAPDLPMGNVLFSTDPTRIRSAFQEYLNQTGFGELIKNHVCIMNTVLIARNIVLPRSNWGQ
jgi:hypothetical protein